jgi:large subunit ribosomal protein L5
MTDPVVDPEMTTDEPTTATEAAPAAAEETTSMAAETEQTAAEPEPTASDAEPTAEAEPAAADATDAEPVAATDEEPAADAAPTGSDAEPVAAAAAEEPEPATKRSRATRPARESNEVVLAAESSAPAMQRGLRVKYASEVVPALVKQFEYANPNQVPKLEKIVVNVGLGEALSNAKAIDAASGDLIMITGQKPIVMKARRSIAQFRVRTGNPIGLKVTLRGQRMWDFLERLTLLTLPRIRDFRGIPSKSFDGRGNYTLGMREQIAFPEIDYDKVDRLRGLEVSIVTTAKSDEESKRLLELLGMPFAG